MNAESVVSIMDAVFNVEPIACTLYLIVSAECSKIAKVCPPVVFNALAIHPPPAQPGANLKEAK